MVKNPPASAGDVKDIGLISGLGGSPGGGHGNPLQYSGEFHGQRSLTSCSPRVTQSWTRLKQLSMHEHTASMMDADDGVKSMYPRSGSHGKQCRESVRKERVPVEFKGFSQRLSSFKPS